MICKNGKRKLFLSSFIDILSGVLYAQIHFCKAAMVVGSLLFISLFSPGSTISKIFPMFRIDSLEDIKNQFITQEASIMIFGFFLLYEIAHVMYLIFLSSVRCEDRSSIIIETIAGVVTVYAGILANNVLTVDRIVFSIIGFYVVIILLNIITRIFFIDTRHFGSYVKGKINDDYQHFVAVDKERI